MLSSLPSTLPAMRRYFRQGATQGLAFRKAQLKQLQKAIEQHEQDIYDALAQDLGKSPEECWVTENGFVLNELRYTLRHLSGWMEKEPVPTNLLNLPAKSYIMHEPLGVVLVIGPWNYPFQLLMAPLIGAIAAGNCVVVKPSEFAPATAQIITRIITETFQTEHVQVVNGSGAEVIPEMMQSFRFDHILYTGSTAVGRIIYKMAAEQLVPVTLELGGKSPCVVEADANLKIAANRITLTKFSNAGQMCIAPDYILAHHAIKDRLLELIRERIIKFFSEDPLHCRDYGKIINEKQFDRLVGYLNQGKVYHGGQHDRSVLHIAPTLLEDVRMDSSVMQEEIFGPILPVLSFSDAAEAREMIEHNPDPLAFYLFTSSKQKEAEWLKAVPSGAACINNASWHATNHHLPFGGRGSSGIGRYHGKFSFTTFSHQKAVLKTPTWIDPAVKYPPFKGKLWLFKKFI